MLTIYQQHRVLDGYRNLIFIELEKLSTQFEHIIAFHKESANYDEKERNEKLEQLTNTFTDFFYSTGDILEVEPKIRDKYFSTFRQMKFEYSELLDSYLTASTLEERDKIYKEISELYNIYSEFLNSSKLQLVKS